MEEQLKEFFETWGNIIPFPPGWWRVKEAADALRVNDLESARASFIQAIQENELYLREHIQYNAKATRHTWKVIVSKDVEQEISLRKFIETLGRFIATEDGYKFLYVDELLERIRDRKKIRFDLHEYD